jgi:hypothetical protein
MTDAQLRAYSAEHLVYELEMLCATAGRLAALQAQRDEDVVLRNALIESFATHARALALFVYPDAGGRRRNADVTADHYVRDLNAWRHARPRLPHELDSVIKRTAKEIAHLTMDRHLPASRPPWRTEPILRAVADPFHRFAAEVSEGRFDARARTLIAALPCIPPTETPPGGEKLGIAPPMPTIDLTTERLSGVTDVSTTSVPPRLGVIPREDLS